MIDAEEGETVVSGRYCEVTLMFVLPRWHPWMFLKAKQKPKDWKIPDHGDAVIH